jgi:hypothetical protein
MKSFKALADGNKNGYFNTVFSLLAEKEKSKKDFVVDSDARSRIKPLSLSTDELRKLGQEQFKQVKRNLVKDSGTVDTIQSFGSRYATFCKQQIAKSPTQVSPELMNGIKDGYFNAITNVGTDADPSMFTLATIPLALSPGEATAYYASAGIPSIIIDKKGKGPLLNGFSFSSTGWSTQDLEKLKEYALKVGFDLAVQNGLIQALIYGGSFTYFTLKEDDPATFLMSFEELIKEKVLDKDSIDYFTTADRWNTVVIPNYIITAKDYLEPSTLFIPLGGVRVATDRGARMRPHPLPFWGAMRQLGWCASEFEGWYRSVLAYKIITMSIPILVQQMSLIFHTYQMDGALAMTGPESMEEYAKLNEQNMRKWSALNPIALNSAGDIKVVERTYSGFENLVDTIERSVGAESGLPRSVLFHPQSQGFGGGNEEEITLKQSEAIKIIANAVQPQIQPMVKYLVVSCFGANSPQAQKAEEVRFNFESSVVLTDAERGKLLTSFSQGVSMFTGSGMTLDEAIIAANKFVPNIRFTQEEIAAFKGRKRENAEPLNKTALPEENKGKVGKGQKPLNRIKED